MSNKQLTRRRGAHDRYFPHQDLVFDSGEKREEATYVVKLLYLHQVLTQRA